ncbi:MAG: hypothetical protein U5K38_10230 [Woeseiaceae bacterium]|nr:hypothetical protein [Woeseiaceae bacterium]
MDMVFWDSSDNSWARNDCCKWTAGSDLLLTVLFLLIRKELVAARVLPRQIREHQCDDNGDRLKRCSKHPPVLHTPEQREKYVAGQQDADPEGRMLRPGLFPVGVSRDVSGQQCENQQTGRDEVVLAKNESLQNAEQQRSSDKGNDCCK